jgi:hypothetical protein
MATGGLDVREQIIAFKRSLAPHRERLKQAFADVKDHVSRAGDAILREVAGGRPVVPELDYRDIRDGRVQEKVRESIRSTTSDPRPTARRIAHIFPNSGRHFCRGVRLLTSRPWTSKSTSRGVRPWRI